MKTTKRIQPVITNESSYFYQHEEGLLWSLGFKNEQGEEKFLMYCYLRKENNRGWTFNLAYSIASTQPKAFLSRGEWEQVEIDK